jgi:hypothetical protein
MAENIIDNVDLNDANNDINTEVQEKVVRITLDGKDISVSFEQLDIDIDSSIKEILDAVAPIIEEAEGTKDGYVDAYGDYTYTARKAMNSSTIYVYPKPVAG